MAVRMDGLRIVGNMAGSPQRECERLEKLEITRDQLDRKILNAKTIGFIGGILCGALIGMIATFAFRCSEYNP